MKKIISALGLVAFIQLSATFAFAGPLCSTVLTASTDLNAWSDAMEDSAMIELISSTNLNRRLFGGSIQKQDLQSSQAKIEAALNSAPLAGQAAEIKARLLKVYTKFKRITDDNPFVDRQQILTLINLEDLQPQSAGWFGSRSKGLFKESSGPLLSTQFLPHELDLRIADNPEETLIYPIDLHKPDAESGEVRIFADSTGIEIHGRRDELIRIKAPADGFATPPIVSHSGLVIVGVKIRSVDKNLQTGVKEKVAIINQEGEVVFLEMDPSKLTSSIFFLADGGVIVQHPDLQITRYDNGGKFKADIVSFVSKFGQLKHINYSGRPDIKIAGNFSAVLGYKLVPSGEQGRWSYKHVVSIFNSNGDLAYEKDEPYDGTFSFHLDQDSDGKQILSLILTGNVSREKLNFKVRKGTLYPIN